MGSKDQVYGKQLENQKVLQKEAVMWVSVKRFFAWDSLQRTPPTKRRPYSQQKQMSHIGLAGGMYIISHIQTVIKPPNPYIYIYVYEMGVYAFYGAGQKGLTGGYDSQVCCELLTNSWDLHFSKPCAKKLLRTLPQVLTSVRDGYTNPNFWMFNLLKNSSVNIQVAVGQK